MSRLEEDIGCLLCTCLSNSNSNLLSAENAYSKRLEAGRISKAMIEADRFADQSKQPELRETLERFKKDLEKRLIEIEKEKRELPEEKVNLIAYCSGTPGIVLPVHANERKMFEDLLYQHCLAILEEKKAKNEPKSYGMDRKFSGFELMVRPDRLEAICRGLENSKVEEFKRTNLSIEVIRLYSIFDYLTLGERTLVSISPDVTEIRRSIEPRRLPSTAMIERYRQEQAEKKLGKKAEEEKELTFSRNELAELAGVTASAVRYNYEERNLIARHSYYGPYHVRLKDLNNWLGRYNRQASIEKGEVVLKIF